MKRNNLEIIVSAFMLAIFSVIAVNAGGPLSIWDSARRIPYRWNVMMPVPIYTDLGPFEVLPANPPAGTVLVTSEKADETVVFAAKQWTDVDTSNFQAQVVGDFASVGLPDVKDAATAAQVILNENSGGLYVIYDADARIMQEFFGAPPSVLGIASPELADEATGIITEGWVVINAQGRWFNDNQLNDYAAVFTHEMGHSINLAHSQTNGAIAAGADTFGPKSCATVPYSKAITKNHVETMFPFINQRPNQGGAAQSTVDMSDDKVALSNLYPSRTYKALSGSITGRVLQTNGTEGITGVNVIARNLDDPYADAVSVMSGDYVRVPAGNDGSFTISGLKPGARYALYTDMIVSGGYPTLQPLYLPEGEEFYNGASESGNGTIDDRCHMEPIVPTYGKAVNADIVLNSVPGAPRFIPLAPNAFARTVSGDGNVVGGGVSPGGTFRWSEEDGYEVLNQTVDSDSTMSRDGLKFGSETLAPNGRRISSILNLGSTWQQLPLPVAAPPAVVMDTCSSITTTARISGDGDSVAGSVSVDANGPEAGQTCRVRPFVWSAQNGSRVLPVPANFVIARSARATGISDDESMIIGWHDQFGPRSGVRWENGQMIEFGTPTFPVQDATYVTPDGNTVVGSNAGPQAKPWIWTRQGGLRLLDRVAPNFSAVALSASDDGQVVGGLGGSFSMFPGDPSGNRAFLWTPELGSVDFENFLKAQGTFFEGWILWSTSSISADGTTHIGTAVGPRGPAGWVIKLENVNLCHANPGDPTKLETINVLFRGGMAEHLSHGDTVGVCTAPAVPGPKR